MKTIFDMTGVERAAALLVALGPQVASDIMRHLDDDSIEKITVEIAKIGKLSPNDKEDLIGEFIIDLRRTKGGLQAGENKARQLLIDAFGEEKADEVISKIKPIDVEEEFKNIKEIETEILIKFLEEENPQTIAVILNYLPSKKSAAVLQSLDKDTAKDVAKRMAKAKMVDPEIISRVAKALNKKYQEHLKKQQGLDQTGGVETLIDIMNHMKSEDEQKIMKNLDTDLPNVYAKIQDKIFNFENIANLSNTEIRILIDEINDDSLLGLSLKGAGDEIRFKVLRNMSQNRATDILKDMDAMGAVRLSEVEEGRSAIMDIAKMLHENGVISFNKGKEEYIY